MYMQEMPTCLYEVDGWIGWLGVGCWAWRFLVLELELGINIPWTGFYLCLVDLRHIILLRFHLWAESLCGMRCAMSGAGGAEGYAAFLWRLHFQGRSRQLLT